MVDSNLLADFVEANNVPFCITVSVLKALSQFDATLKINVRERTERRSPAQTLRC